MNIELTDGVATVLVDEDLIIDFLSFIQKCEECKLFNDKGVFKARLHPQQHRPTSVSELLKELASHIMSNQEFSPNQQFFDRHSEKLNIFTCRSVQLPQNSENMIHFMNTLENPLLFADDQVTCCSQQLVEGGIESLLNHFWEVIFNTSSPAHNMKAEVTDYVLKAMVAAGKKMRYSFQKSERHPWLHVREVMNLTRTPSPAMVVKDLMKIAEKEAATEGDISAKNKKNNTWVRNGKNSTFDKIVKNGNKSTDETEELKGQENNRHISKLRGCVSRAKDSILYAARIHVHEEKNLNITDHFSLFHLQTILDLHPDKYPGLSVPNYFVGTTHSSSSFQVGEAGLPSVTYLHYGAPKVWIVLSPEYVFLFIKCLSASPLPSVHSSCSNVLGHKVVAVDTIFLKQHGIPYSVVVQYPGEFVFIAPQAAHFVFNCGMNLAVTVNFATESWIMDGVYSPRCQCYGSDLIHLDMKPFLAMYHPHLLESYCRGNLYQYGPPAVGQHYVSVNHTFQKIDKWSPKTIEKPNCEAMEDESHEVPLHSSSQDGRLESSKLDHQHTLITAEREFKPSGETSNHVEEALILRCLACSKTYKGSFAKQLKRLLNHCVKKHSSTPHLLQQTKDKYPHPRGKMVKKFQCQICGQLFAGAPSNLRRHLRQVHSFETTNSASNI